MDGGTAEPRVDARTWMLVFLVSLTMVFFTTSPLMALKRIDFLGEEFVAGVPIITLGLMMIDVVNNNYGKSVARRVVLLTVPVRLIAWLVFWSTLWWPTAREPENMDAIAHQAFRLFLGAEAAAVTAQYLFDVPIFAFVKRLFHGKLFFVRYNVSNILSGVVSSFVFITIAFGTPDDYLDLVRGNFMSRLILGILATPIAVVINYFAVQFITERWKAHFPRFGLKGAD